MHTRCECVIKVSSDKLGTVGMLLSVPLTMIVKIGLENSPEGRWLAILLSDEESVEQEVKQINPSK